MTKNKNWDQLGRIAGILGKMVCRKPHLKPTREIESCPGSFQHLIPVADNNRETRK